MQFLKLAPTFWALFFWLPYLIFDMCTRLLLKFVHACWTFVLLEVPTTKLSRTGSMAMRPFANYAVSLTWKSDARFELP